MDSNEFNADDISSIVLLWNKIVIVKLNEILYNFLQRIG